MRKSVGDDRSKCIFDGTTKRTATQHTTQDGVPQLSHSAEEHSTVQYSANTKENCETVE